MHKLNPLLFEIKLKSSNNFFKKISQDVTQIKDKFKFAELKIKEDEISFKKSLLYNYYNITENEISILCLNTTSNNGISGVNRVMNLLRESNFPITSIGNSIQNLKIVNFFSFNEDKDILKFFFGTSSNNLVIPDDIHIGFNYMDEDQKEIKTIANFSNTTCWFSMELAEPCISTNTDDPASCLNETIIFLCDKMERYIESRKANATVVSVGDGESE